MSTTTRRSRTVLASALSAAVIAALLSACAQTDSTPNARAADAQATEAMPEVVIVASRERPDSRG